MNRKVIAIPNTGIQPNNLRNHVVTSEANILEGWLLTSSMD